MSFRAAVFMAGITSAALTVTALAWVSIAWAALPWLTFAVLTGLATVARVWRVEGSRQPAGGPALVFFVAGVLLLPPGLFPLLALAPHLVDVVTQHARRCGRRTWYGLPIAWSTHVLAGAAAAHLYALLHPDGGSIDQAPAIAAVITSAVTYILVHHLLASMALTLASGNSWRESGVWTIETVLADLSLALLGIVAAVVWPVSPWLAALALSPLVLMHQALAVPTLRHEAQTDGKTGLLNARHVTRRYQAEFERARRFHRPLAVIVADLDLLRDVNNAFGHLAGDLVLAGVGQALPRAVREFDIVGRFGGEEFVIVLPEAGPAEARVIAERIRQTIEAAHFSVPTSSLPIGVTMSVGVACYPGLAADSTSLLHEADVAAFEAKLLGRNRVVSAGDLASARTGEC
ncbi:MAG: GGDEF domain-containing protein [Chloroflexi bacterium]|nr:GGDEF domain-containing protein [Chloroflexota bacterium]